MSCQETLNPLAPGGVASAGTVDKLGPLAGGNVLDCVQKNGPIGAGGNSRHDEERLGQGAGLITN